jgi:hypothetical protein
MKASTLDKAVDIGRIGNHYTKGSSERAVISIDAKANTVTYQIRGGMTATVSTLEWKHWKRNSRCTFRKSA